VPTDKTVTRVIAIMLSVVTVFSVLSVHYCPLKMDKVKN